MELNGGTNDMFAAWEDAGGITMGHWDYSKSKLWTLAQQYVLADNFYMGAFGGSFLTHQYLICACAPTVSAAWVTSNKPSVNMLGTPNGKGVPQLALNAADHADAGLGARRPAGVPDRQHRPARLLRDGATATARSTRCSRPISRAATPRRRARRICATRIRPRANTLAAADPDDDRRPPDRASRSTGPGTRPTGTPPPSTAAGSVHRRRAR